MDRNSNNSYNRENISFGVIDVSTVQMTPTSLRKTENTKNKPQSISELRKMLAIKTAPGHSLLQLYKRGQQ
jgi:hypothetical protein